MIKKINNKGFAITGILYTLFILFILTLVSLLGGLQTKKQMLEKNTEKLEESYKGTEVTNDSNIGVTKAISEKRALVKGKYIFELSAIANLLFGLNNIQNATDSTNRATYSISNKVVTVTSKTNDGYVLLNTYVYLETGKTYTFSCDTTGTWGNTGDTVEAYLMLNGQYNTYYHMASNKDYQFTPTTSGQYTLRLDVNQSTKTYSFSNIRITDNIQKVTCSSYLNKGDKIDKENMKFTPKDCNDYNYTFTNQNNNLEGITMTLKNIYSFESE